MHTDMYSGFVMFTDRKNMKGVVVPPSEPRTHAGLYWGYTVRLAGTLVLKSSCIFNALYSCPSIFIRVQKNIRILL